MTDTGAVLLFSYGTLRQENVQLQAFGRRLQGRAGALPGYRRERVARHFIASELGVSESPFSAT